MYFMNKYYCFFSQIEIHLKKSHFGIIKIKIVEITSLILRLI